MKAQIYNIEGQDLGESIDLPTEIFGIEPNDHAIYLDVKQFLANQRQGTHKTKDKSEITASTKKIKRQKGTGTARAGSVKSGVMRGGGRFHGPRPRDYSFKLNKNLKKVARKSALSYKAKSEDVLLLKDLNMENPSTKMLNSIIHNLALNDVRTIFVSNDYDKNLYLSGRNIPKVEIKRAVDLCTYDIMKAKKLVLLEGSIDKIIETLN